MSDALTKTRFEVVGGVVFLAIFVGWLVWEGVVPKFRSLGADGAVVTFDVSFDGAEAGSTINDRLAGSLIVPELLQDVAVCRNGPDWMSDITLNNRVIVSTRPDRVRAAELGDSGRFEWELVGQVERNLWRGVHPPSLPAFLEAEGLDRDTVEEYLVAREVSPSVEAQSRFVAYAAATDLLGHGQLRIIDSTRLDSGTIRSFADDVGSPMIFVAGVGAEPRRLPPSSCRAALSELERV
ncbi:MAG: hypothetical protein QNJ12_16940 [Ilumatobacter sp.]|uniref:hypothetical protein n=1 Tax=Ilumatobacter sp. TaxID=1967498 RepID=UPI002631B8B2|nr:hypothetical protein [Ilumatobacter sp.]MDJ0770482.1 hypothetical protein [Ilumatobacter sp.]